MDGTSERGSERLPPPRRGGDDDAVEAANADAGNDLLGSPSAVASLRHQLGCQASSVRCVVYPGFGLTIAEAAELDPVVTAFRRDTKLVRIEEAWQ